MRSIFRPLTASVLVVVFASSAHGQIAPSSSSQRSEPRPGDGAPVTGVHPSFVLERIRPVDFEPKVASLAFLPDGRLVVGTFDPLQRDEIALPDINAKEPDRLWAVVGLMGDDPAAIAVEPLADGLFEPTGLAVVGADLYVAHRTAITRLRDIDGDGFYEEHVDVASGWEAWNYHQFTFGLVHLPDLETPDRAGRLVTALSTAMAPPAWEGMGTNAAPNGPLRGAAIEVDLTSRSVRAIGGGLRTPNGIVRVPGNRILIADNEGTWLPASTLVELEAGRFYGHANNTNVVPKLLERFPLGGVASIFCDRPRVRPVAYLPHNECMNSPTQMVVVPDGPYAGDLLVGDLTGGGLRRVALEEVDGVLQGTVFHHSQGFECGVHRLAWGPDGRLYVGGLGAKGNWNWRGTQFGLERLRPTGEVPFELRAVSTTTTRSLVVAFTEPLDPASAGDPSRYEVASWRYRPTAAYGGPKVDVRPHAVRRATLRFDRRSVELEIAWDGRDDEIAAGIERCVHVRARPDAASGRPMWAGEAWATIVRFPVERAALVLDGRPVRGGDIGPRSEPDGMAHQLVNAAGQGPWLDGAGRPLPSTSHGQAELVGGAVDGVLSAVGSITTSTTHGAARLHIEWSGGPIEVVAMGAAPIRLEPRPDASGWSSADCWWSRREDEGGIGATVIVGEEVVLRDVVLPVDGAAARDAGPLGISAVEGGAFALRNVWLQPLEATDDGAFASDDPLAGRRRWTPGSWRPIWDGETLDGWVVRGGDASYRVESGAIVGTTAPNTPNTFLVRENLDRDFELLVEVLVDPELNSGIQIRSGIVEAGSATDDVGLATPADLGPRDGRMRGLQVEIDPSERGFTAGIYDEARRGWLAPLADNPAARAAFRPGAWNRIRILARGCRIETWLNGVPAASIIDCVDRDGRIGLQVHGVGDRKEPLEVRWRRIAYRPWFVVE
jgi:glucose/arabinose dehydrogenase